MLSKYDEFWQQFQEKELPDACSVDCEEVA